MLRLHHTVVATTLQLFGKLLTRIQDVKHIRRNADKTVADFITTNVTITREVIVGKSQLGIIMFRWTIHLHLELIVCPLVFLAVQIFLGMLNGIGTNFNDIEVALINILVYDELLILIDVLKHADVFIQSNLFFVHRKLIVFPTNIAVHRQAIVLDQLREVLDHVDDPDGILLITYGIITVIEAQRLMEHKRMTDIEVVFAYVHTVVLGFPLAGFTITKGKVVALAEEAVIEGVGTTHRVVKDCLAG